MSTKKVIIIGSGFGGLGAACLLQSQGFEVHIYEQGDRVGGRAGLLEIDGFLFDKGPSWYMMPDVFEHFFEILGENIHDYITLERLSPSYRIFMESNKAHYDFYSDISKNKQLFESLEPGSGNKLEKFIEQTKNQYEIAKNEFMVKNYNTLFDFFTWRVIKLGMKLPLFKKQASIISDIFSHEVLQKVMQYQTVLLGTDPKDTPGIYSLMNYVDFGLGVWYPKGGIYEVIKALETIARAKGVTIHTSTKVKKNYCRKK